MAKAAIIHGTGGSPSGNWFPWLAAELQTRGYEAITPKMPTPAGQSLAGWLEAFAEQVGTIDDSTLLIGHSIGAVFLARLLERASVPVRSCVFVCPFTGELGLPEFDLLNATFVRGGFDWPTIRANGGEMSVICGDDDPYVPMVQPLEFAQGLGVTPIIVPGGKHLNAAAGMTSLPRVLECLNIDG